jgi:hypothetical protein
MKKGLKQTIYETVSTPRDLFVKIRTNRDSKTTEIDKRTKQVTMMKAELQQCNGTHAKEHRTPSIIHGTEPADRMVKEHDMTHMIPCLEPAWTTKRKMAPPSGRGGKLYSKAVGGKEELENFQNDSQIER